MADVDLFVIGAGSGGVRAARIAAGYGARVMVAEEYRVGGTCVIRGCVPKKLLVYAARFADDFKDAAGYGWTLDEPVFDWAKLIANKDREIARLESAYVATLERAKVALVRSRAVIEDANTVRLLASGETVRAATILIATGAAPYPGAEIAGLQHVISSNEAFHLEALPRHILIQGGGYIAVEFAGIFRGLGAQVTLVYRGDNILRGFDDDVREHLRSEMERRGITVITRQTVDAVELVEHGFCVELSNRRSFVVDRVMFATGRRPNVTGLGLEAAGVRIAKSGGIAVDEFSCSSVASIYAVGDVTNRVNLTPVAIREGHAFADTVFANTPVCVDHDLVPTAVFATPEIGTVGLPEHLAQARYPKLDVYKARFRPLKHTLSGRDERMFMKLLVDGESGRIVGCHFLGPDAAELTQMAAITMRVGATKADFDATMALHPSASEELVTMREKWVAPAKPVASEKARQQ